MDTVLRFLVAIAWLALAASCGDDAASDEGSAAAGNGSSSDLCHEGCVATLAASCDSGPSSLEGCESDCNALTAGPCGMEYQALQSCADGEAITCDAQGLPAIEACAAEQSTFVACLN